MLPILPTTSPLSKLQLGIPGTHQISNAQLAIELYRTFLRSNVGQAEFQGDALPIINEEITEVERKGLSEARWPGRCQTVHTKDRSRSWYLDGAHTTESLESCAAWFVRASKKDSQGCQSVKRSLIFNTTHDRKSEELLSGMMTAVGKELSRLYRDKEGVETFFESAIFCTNTTYKDGASSGGESNLFSLSFVEG